ncbi:MAG: RluA family pseudouridine synthase [Chlamydiales bacterium]|jgi:tRNA pseudouridine32 synthase/23S rRNA pseudouridine746 synthase/23S rRNA pseudouridine1911/1915/1917 synthase|nr:RluA family pseudouridine synthase [Chlamydiales bacterium]
MKFVVDKNICLQDVLKTFFPKSSKTALRSWMHSGRVLVDSHYATDLGIELQQGQCVTIRDKFVFLDEGIKVLYEDEAVIVVEKPEGMLSVATDFETKNTLQNILKIRLRRKNVFAVHRLDRETSGIMMFACSESAKQSLKTQFEKSQIQKTYYALVEGKLATQQGCWQSYLKEDEKYFVRSTSIENGKLAITEFDQIWNNKQFSFLRLKLLTGKKNQLRVHCSEAGHPIVGDKKYRANTNPLRRMALHAYSLTFSHPTKQKKMTFIAPLPLGFYKIAPIENLSSLNM